MRLCSLYLLTTVALYTTYAAGRIMDYGTQMGYVHPKYEEIRKVFRENFEQGLESAGASFAVFENGEMVVDLYGGIAKEEIGQVWTEHSQSILFSTTKSISATVLAYIMDKEGVSYDTKVTSFWPEFGKNGKENTTILQIVLHQAGLPYSSQHISRDDVTDHRKMSRYFEDATPAWIPGQATGYHALTIGFLIDQLLRRIDKKGRGVVDIFNEDFKQKYDFDDLSIGLTSRCHNNRVALLRTTTEEDMERERERNPEAVRRYLAGNNVHNMKLYETWPWITTDDYNLIENRLLAMPSNMGIGNAKGLARFHSLLAEKRILSPSFYSSHLSSPVLVDQMDVVNGYPESKGYGYQFTKSPKGDWIFGHSGFGGQNVRVDCGRGLSYAYVTNGLKVSDADMVETWSRLVEKLYELL